MNDASWLWPFSLGIFRDYASATFQRSDAGRAWLVALTLGLRGATMDDGIFVYNFLVLLG
jgi:hypothetical protein